MSFRSILYGILKGGASALSGAPPPVIEETEADALRRLAATRLLVISQLSTQRDEWKTLYMTQGPQHAEAQFLLEDAIVALRGELASTRKALVATYRRHSEPFPEQLEEAIDLRGSPVDLAIAYRNKTSKAASEIIAGEVSSRCPGTDRPVGWRPAVAGEPSAAPGICSVCGGHVAFYQLANITPPASVVELRTEGALPTLTTHSVAVAHRPARPGTTAAPSL